LTKTFDIKISYMEGCMSNVTGTMKADALAGAARKVSLTSMLKRGALGGGLAVAGNLLLYLLARFVFGLGLIMPPIPPATEPAPLLLAPVVLLSFVPGLGAAVVYWLLGKFSANPRRLFLIVSVVLLLLSFAGPFALPVALSTQIILNLMHIVAGAAIIGALARR
jgi:hypothetical protein